MTGTVVSEYTKVSYTVVTDFDKGVWSEPFQSQGFMDENPDHEHTYSDEGDCTHPGCQVHRFDMGSMGPHPFSAGFPTLEATQDTVRRAQEYVAGLGPGRVWVEKITETVTRERLT